jgi:hypothetical protein
VTVFDMCKEFGRGWCQGRREAYGRSTSLHAHEPECRLSHRMSDPLTAASGAGQK